MFGFGKKEKEAPQQPQPHRPVQPVYRPPTLEQKYGVSPDDCIAQGAGLNNLFGGEELDYLFARYASDHSRALFQIRDDLSRFMSQEKDLKEEQETSTFWRGKYFELERNYYEFMERYDAMQENLKSMQLSMQALVEQINKERDTSPSR